MAERTDSDLLSATIVPNKSAAGIKIGATKDTVLKNWGDPIEIEEIDHNSVRWKYNDVDFWIDNGSVEQIGVSGCYDGKTKEGIGLGSSRSEVERNYGMLEWDGAWITDYPVVGIGFDLVMGKVSTIFVFR